MWQRDSIWCYLPEECHRCFLSPAAVCSTSATQEWCHWRYYEPLSNLQRSETQISATQKCKQTHLSSVEVSQRRPEFFFDFTKMFFHSRTNWWGVPGIQPLMSFSLRRWPWESLLSCELLETQEPRRDSFVSPFLSRPLCWSLHGVHTKYNDITAFSLHSSPFSTRPPPVVDTTGGNFHHRLVRLLTSTFRPRSPCHAPAADHVSWRSDTNTTQTNYTTGRQIMGYNRAGSQCTTPWNTNWSTRSPRQTVIFRRERSLCLSSEGLHQCPLTGEEAQVLDLLKRCWHRSLRTQLCGTGAKPFQNQDRSLVAFNSTHQISRLQLQIKQPEEKEDLRQKTKKQKQRFTQLRSYFSICTTSTHTSLHLPIPLANPSTTHGRALIKVADENNCHLNIKLLHIHG